jgi:hypothetical protein
MTKQQKERFLKISSISSRTKPVPFIRISGKWLEDVGFEVNTSIRITVSKERLIIVPDFERPMRVRDCEIKKLKRRLTELENQKEDE